MRTRLRSRSSCSTWAGLGPKTFEQAAGFCASRNGDDPLDMTGVHPETYPVVPKAAGRHRPPGARADGPCRVAAPLRPQTLPDERFGAITVKGHPPELEKPGRTRAPTSRSGRFNDSVTELKDLQPGMVLEGTVRTWPRSAPSSTWAGTRTARPPQPDEPQVRQRPRSEVVKTGTVVKGSVLEGTWPQAHRACDEARRAGGAPHAAQADNRFQPASGPQRSRFSGAGRPPRQTPWPRPSPSAGPP